VGYYARPEIPVTGYKDGLSRKGSEAAIAINNPHSNPTAMLLQEPTETEETTNLNDEDGDRIPICFQ